MIEKTTATPQRRFQLKPYSALSIAVIRLINDAMFFVLTMFAIYNITEYRGMVLGIPATTFYASINGLILIGSVTALILIRRNRIDLGINILIYSLIIGMFINSIFIEGVSPFGLVMTLFFTIMTISRSFSFREGVNHVVVSIVFGVSALAFDTIFQGAAFRAQPAFGDQSIWAPTIFFALLTVYMIIRQFPLLALRAKLISSIVVVTVLSLGLLLLSTILSLRQILTTEADEALFAAASQTANSIDDFLSNHAQTIESLATLPSIIEFTANSDALSAPEVDDLLRNFSMVQDEYVLSFSIIDTEGIVIAHSRDEMLGLPAENFAPFFESGQSDITVITDMLYDAYLDAPIIYITTPIKDRDATSIGVIRVKLHAKFLQDLVERSNGLVGLDSFSVLFDEYFIHLAHGTHPETLFTTVAPIEDLLFADLMEEKRLPFWGKEILFLDLLELEESLIQAQSSDDPVTYFNATDVATGDRPDRGAVVKVNNTPWLLAFFQPEDIFLQPLSTLGDSSLFFFIISGVFATGIGLILTNVIIRPISYLNETAINMTEGDFSSRVEIVSEDELGTLGDTFNMMAIQLENLIDNLETEVSERTEDLQNQTVQLMATAEIARDASSEEELEFLLERAAFLLYDRFNFYHVGIYLIDGSEQYAILSTSQDPQGQQLISNQHKYLIDSESSVGRAVTSSTPQVSSIKQEDEISQHPLLPDTQSQLSLPLRVSGKILGVIDIHSTDQGDFSEEQVGIFGTFADQIAIAIQRTEFSQEIQQTLNELETAYGQFTQESWRRFIQGKRDQFAGYRFRQLTVEPLESQPTEVVEAWTAGEVVSLTQSEQGTSIMAIPMKIRDEVIGVLDLEFESEMVPPDTQNLMTEIAARLSLVLENARLVEIAQEQVEREQLAAHINDRISQSLDLDTVLRTATQEIGATLGLDEVEIRLGSIDLGFQMSDNGGRNTAGLPPQPPPPVSSNPMDSALNEDDHEPIE